MSYDSNDCHNTLNKIKIIFPTLIALLKNQSILMYITGCMLVKHDEINVTNVY